jgi:hypothetical protein
MAEIDPRVLSAADHVQKAALELIAALRNALDLAEDLLVNAPMPPPSTPPAQSPGPSERVERIRLDD